MMPDPQPHAPQPFAPHPPDPHPDAPHPQEPSPQDPPSQDLPPNEPTPPPPPPKKRVRSRHLRLHVHVRLRALMWLAVAIVAAAFLGMGAIVWDGLSDELGRADAGVVLGSKVETTGQPSERLKARLDHAVELYRAGYFRVVIVSGGTGKEGFDEAKVMADYLAQKGIPPERILQDANGLTSWHTARNTARILRANHMKSVLLVSQYFHISRTRLAFRKFGVEPIYASHADYFALRDFYSVPRELIGYFAYLFRQGGK